MKQLPLSGVTVLDMSTILAGPLAATLLGEFGADVIKIEQPGTGDPARRYPPLDGDTSANWQVLGRNKRSVTIDFHAAGAAELVGRLTEHADIVVTNFRPETLAGFGVDFEDLKAYRSDIVMVHVSAFGRTGPYRDRPGFARIAEGFSGLTHRTGPADGPPTFVGYPVADGVTGMYSAFAAMLALRQRDLTGEAQLADIALYEPLLRMMEDFIADYGTTGTSVSRQGNLNPHVAPNDLYRSRDGRWIAIPASTNRMWERLADLMGADDLRHLDTMDARVRNRELVESRVSEWVAARDAEDLLELLLAAGVAGGPINSAEELCRDPHIVERGSVVEVEEAPGRTRLVQAPAGRFSGFTGRVGGRGPELGEHTEEILSGLLGLDPAAIDDLRSRGVL